MTFAIDKKTDSWYGRVSPSLSLRTEGLALICLLLPVGFVARALLQPGTILWGGDISTYFYPLTAAGMAQWQAGRVPLWTSGVQAGFPLLADGQGALLYPLNLILHPSLLLRLLRIWAFSWRSWAQPRSCMPVPGQWGWAEFPLCSPPGSG